PDARDVGAKLVVHLDISVLINGDAGFIEAEVVRIWSPADRDQQVGTDDLRGFSPGFDLHGYGFALLLHTDHFTVEAQVDAFLAEKIADRLRDVLVLPRDQARPELDQGHLAAEAAIHLGEFKSDVAAAQDDEMWREKIYLHHRAVGEVGDLVEAGNRGDY